jgi:hypothetical protein
VKIIRGRLNAADVSSPDLRYDATCNCIQRTADGGATWRDSPGDDPRISDTYRYPHRTGADRRCVAAANALKWFKDFMDNVIALLTDAAGVLIIVNALLDVIDLLFPGADFLTLILDAAEALATLGETALSAAFTSTQYDIFKCILFCEMDANGQLSADAFSAVMSQVSAQMNTTAALVTNTILNIQGAVGVSNAGAIGTATGDCTACTACGWCYHFDDAHRLSEWLAQGWFTTQQVSMPTYAGGNWLNGLVDAGVNGSTHDATYIMISWILPSTITLTDAAITGFTGTLGASGQGIWINGDGTQFSGTQIWSSAGYLPTSPVSVDRIDVSFFLIDSHADLSISSLQFAGTDEINPFGDNDC